MKKISMINSPILAKICFRKPKQGIAKTILQLLSKEQV